MLGLSIFASAGDHDQELEQLHVSHLTWEPLTWETCVPFFITTESDEGWWGRMPRLWGWGGVWSYKGVLLVLCPTPSTTRNLSRTESCTCIFRELYGFSTAFPLVNRQNLLAFLIGQHNYHLVDSDSWGGNMWVRIGWIPWTGWGQSCVFTNMRGMGQQSSALSEE